MVDKKKGPIEGTYIPVKLPWNGATSGEPQFVSMKEPIALLLGLDQAEDKDLEYEIVVKTKKNGSKTIKRRRRPGKRTEAIRCHFGKDAGGNDISKKIGGKSVKSFQFPITNSVAIHEVIKFFEKNSKGKALKVKRVVKVSTGQGYPVRQ